MALYAALHPFQLSLHDLLQSSQVSLIPTSRGIVETAYNEIESLYEVVKTSERLYRRSREWGDRVRAFDEQIREAVWKVEDKLDEHLSTRYHEKTTASDHKLTVDLKKVNPEIISFIQLLVKIREEYDEIEQEVGYDEEIMQLEVDDYVEESVDKESLEYEEAELQSMSNYRMVGLVDQFIQLRRLLLTKGRGGYWDAISIVGMAGIGKTAMAKQLFNDPLISNYFKCCAFVSVGRCSQWKPVIIDILSQIQHNLDAVTMQSIPIQKLLNHLKICMARYRCLIVLDDVWGDTKSEIMLNCVYASLGMSSIVLTTRIQTVAPDFGLHCKTVKLRLLNEEESWSLFCEKVFGKRFWCPYELVKVGKKIVENCEGLPLAIIAIANHLVKVDMTLEYWEKVSDDPNPLSIGTNDQDPALDVLFSSYDELSQCLKACFLYMGIFPRTQEISTSKLTKLWEAERLASDEGALSILNSLSSQCMIFVTLSTSENGIKTSRIHSVFWHLCLSEAKKENLFQVLSKLSRNSFQEVLNGHRRICVHNNTLFGIKVANNLMSSVSNARSLLCTGPHHHYPIPTQFQMRLLRVLDVVTIRFYVFPIEVVELIQLRYLALTYNGMLPASISQLWNLEFLIVEQHSSIISHQVPLYIPMEIWNMKELRHLQVTGAHLLHPPDGAILPKLSSISKINARCLTTAVFNSIPSLQKLSIQIDISVVDPFCFSNHLSRVNTLHSLKCIIVNPMLRSPNVVPPSPTKIFPAELRKLTLSGFGYPWKYFKELCKIKNLEVLKLRNYAFQGPLWEADLYEGWPRVLHLEDVDLVHWRATLDYFTCFKKLTIRHCYRLREIPPEFGSLFHLKSIEVVEVQPSVVASAKNIVQRLKRQGRNPRLNVTCSCDDRN